MNYSVQTEQKDQRQVDIEPMFVEAMKKGHGVAWELDLPFGAFGGRQTAKVCSKFFLKRHFGGQSKLLYLADRTVNYGALNGPIIAHVLTERYNK